MHNEYSNIHQYTTMVVYHAACDSSHPSKVETGLGDSQKLPESRGVACGHVFLLNIDICPKKGIL